MPGSAVAEEGRWAIRASDAHREAGLRAADHDLLKGDVVRSFCRSQLPATLQHWLCPVAAPIPSSALGATGVDVLARATRLATPPRLAQRVRAQLTLAAVSALLVVGPLLTVLLTATGVAMCDPVIG